MGKEMEKFNLGSRYAHLGWTLPASFDYRDKKSGLAKYQDPERWTLCALFFTRVASNSAPELGVSNRKQPVVGKYCSRFTTESFEDGNARNVESREECAV
jgi:hypothetical protein